MKKLFHNLVWPAAAGNVAWAFFNVAISESWTARTVGARLATLLVLAAYLASDWLATDMEMEGKRLKAYYWIGDAFHAPTVVVLAIATEKNTAWLSYSLGALLIVAILGHLSRVWEPIGEISRPWLRRGALVSISGVGLLLLWAGAWVLPSGSLWHLPLALGVPVALWTAYRERIYDQTA